MRAASMFAAAIAMTAGAAWAQGARQASTSQDPEAAPACAGAVIDGACVETDRDLVALWQGELAERGCPVGVVDGLWGPKARSVAARVARETGVAIDLTAEGRDAAAIIAAVRSVETADCACPPDLVLQGDGRCLAPAAPPPPPPVAVEAPPPPPAETGIAAELDAPDALAEPEPAPVRRICGVRELYDRFDRDDCDCPPGYVASRQLLKCRRE